MTTREHFKLSTVGGACAPNQIKSLVAPFVGVSDVVVMAQGAPPPSVFPVIGITLDLADGTKVRIDDPTVVADMQQYQYGRSGYMPLLEWCRDFSTKHHRIKDDNWNVALHAGSTDAIAKLAEVLADPGDVIFSEAYTWSTPLDGMRTRGVKLVGVDVDDKGLVPSSLEHECVLLHSQGFQLKALYIVPNGSNPCGTTLAPERYGAIYDICLRYGIVIFEDDPYWWLSLGEGAPLPGPRTSFASIDSAGIVVRIDSFAKSIAPGFRLGWLTGPPRLVHAFNAVCSTTTHNGSPFAMVALHSMLDQWGDEGLNAHISRMRAEYRRRMDIVVAAAEEHLKGLATWTLPKAGMFLYLDLTPSRVEDSTTLLAKLREHRVLVLPSSIFSPVGRTSPHIRISFSQATDEDMVKGVTRLAALLIDHRHNAAAAG